MGAVFLFVAQRLKRVREECDYLGGYTCERRVELMSQVFLRFFLLMGGEQALIVFLLEPSLVLTSNFVLVFVHRQPCLIIASKATTAAGKQKKKKAKSCIEDEIFEARNAWALPIRA